MGDFFSKLHSRAMVKVSAPWNIILFITNIVLPGVGTCLLSLCAKKCNFDSILLGFFQLITVPILLIGWIWSIWYGFEIYEKGG